jgi:NDP-sugar pyrophosphorylase family protein
MNIVIPMVGLGKRFSNVGFSRPKPLIIVDSKPIFQHAIESFNIEGNYIFIIKTSDF